MRGAFSIAFALLVATSLATTASGVLLDSTGKNNEFIGVANLTNSYAYRPYDLVGICYNNTARDVSWTVPKNCSESNPEICWATTCSPDESCWATDCAGCMDVPPDCPQCVNPSLYISVASRHKAELQYFAKNHKEVGQGLCVFTIGDSSFSLSFEFRQTGIHFSLFLWDPSGTTWHTGNPQTSCPSVPQLRRVDEPFATFEYPNTEVTDQENLICNNNFIVSLAADPEISNGAMLTVTNNIYGLLMGVQEARAEFPRTPGETRVGEEAPTERRRLANRVTEHGRWLVTGDGEGKGFRGVLSAVGPSGSLGERAPEFVACERSISGGGERPVLEDDDYACHFSSEDGTQTRMESLRLPGTLLRARPLAGPEGSLGNEAPETWFGAGVLSRISELSRRARVAVPGEDTEGMSPIVWHADSADRSIMMVQDRPADRLEIVHHSLQGRSPVFTTCEELSEDPRNLDYVCRSSTRCIGAPCPPEAWSAGRVMEFPKALFKSRPCQLGGGGIVEKARLDLKRLGASQRAPGLRFRSTVSFEDEAEVKPQDNGFRLLVEDAKGRTVVDVDVPSVNSVGKRDTRSGRSRGWRVRKDGEVLEYRAGTSNGGVVPRVKIRKRGKRLNRWEIDVKGQRGVFGEDELALPLFASLSLDVEDTNTNSCAVIPFVEPSPTRPGGGSASELAESACKRTDEGRSIRCRQKKDRSASD